MYRPCVRSSGTDQPPHPLASRMISVNKAPSVTSLLDHYRWKHMTRLLLLLPGCFPQKIKASGYSLGPSLISSGSSWPHQYLVTCSLWLHLPRPGGEINTGYLTTLFTVLPSWSSSDAARLDPQPHLMMPYIMHVQGKCGMRSCTDAPERPSLNKLPYTGISSIASWCACLLHTVSISQIKRFIQLYADDCWW